MKTLVKNEIFGVKMTTSSQHEILEYIKERLLITGKQVIIVTPNPEIIMYARKNPEFRKIINEADIALPDGVGISLASKVLNLGTIKRIAGVEFMEELVKLTAELNKGEKGGHGNTKKAYDIGLFGGLGGVAELTSLCLQKKYSGTSITYTSSEWDTHKLPHKKMSILFVALGHPKQEKWVSENRDKIPAEIIMTVGGSFDFISGRVRRAPEVFQKLGLEWLFRLVNQPWRWKRQLALLTFIGLIIREKVKI